MLYSVMEPGVEHKLEQSWYDHNQPVHQSWLCQEPKHNFPLWLHNNSSLDKASARHKVAGMGESTDEDFYRLD